MKLPSIKDVAGALIRAKRQIGSDDMFVLDVRLQVLEDEDWVIHTGDAQYDTDHSGFWGAGYLTKCSNCRDLARDLINEAAEQAAMAE